MQITSQHPYAEDFIGKPYVYTVNVKNHDEVEKVVKEIMLKEVSGFPYPSTAKGTFDKKKRKLMSNCPTKPTGVTTQMKVLDEYFLMVAFT